MFGGKRAVFLGDAFHVGTSIEDPDVFGFEALLEEDDVGFDTLAVGGEGASGKAEDGVEVAVLYEDFEDFPGFVLEKAIIGKNDGGPPAGLENGKNVLDEIQLFVTGLDGEIVAFWSLAGTFGPERRVGEDDVESHGRGGNVDGIS